MNGFINHILKRHFNANNNIEPRIPGRFEQINFENSSDHKANLVEQNDEVIAPLNKKMEKEEKAFQNFEDVNQTNPTSNIEKKSVDKEPFLDLNPTINSDINRDLDDYLDYGSFQKKNKLNFNEHNFEKNNFGDSRKTEGVPQLKKNDYAAAQKDVFNVINNAFYQDNYPLQKNLSVNNFSFKEKANQTESPVIKVSIGRIDVRAIVSSQPEKTISNARQKPSMSLEDYLKKRNNGK